MSDGRRVRRSSEILCHACRSARRRGGTSAERGVSCNWRSDAHHFRQRLDFLINSPVLLLELREDVRYQV